MYTIPYKIEHTLHIKNSRFIACLFPVHSKLDIQKAIAECKQKYPDATHYCYAYVLEEKETQAKDDHEPSGTAGIPILTVLESQEWNDVLCVVVRYFGGIKLGAKGLVRAYRKSATEVLKKAPRMRQSQGFQIEITISYDRQKQVDLLLKNDQVVARSFQEIVKIIANVSLETIEQLKEHQIPFEIIQAIKIEKEFL